MPGKDVRKSAVKTFAQSERARLRHKATRNALWTTEKKLRAAVEASMQLLTKPSNPVQCTRTRRTERNPASANSLQKRLRSKSSPNNFSGFQFYLNKRRMGNFLIRLCFIKTKRKYSVKCRFRD